MLTQAYLKECLEYDPETGVFRWRARPVEHFKPTKICRERGALSWNAAYAGKTAGSLANTGYTAIRVDKKAYLAHRLAWLYVYGSFPQETIDHVNMDKTDNRVENLRLASYAQNNTNTTKSARNTSGFKGVSYSKTGKGWGAWVQVRGKSICLGIFNAPEEAHVAYRRAAEQHFGEFARFA